MAKRKTKVTDEQIELHDTDVDETQSDETTDDQTEGMATIDQGGVQDITVDPSGQELGPDGVPENSESDGEAKPQEDQGVDITSQDGSASNDSVKPEGGFHVPVCTCGTEMEIVKKTLKRRFDMKNRVTYHDALQCHCPNCHRLKDVEV